MRNKNFLYFESHALPINVYLVFFIYIITSMLIANIVTVSTINYFVYLMFGIIGICILVVTYSYNLTITRQNLEFSIKIPFKISLLKLRVLDIASLAECNEECGKGNLKQNYRRLGFGNKNGLKVTMQTGKVYIIYGINTTSIINNIKSIEKK